MTRQKATAWTLMAVRTQLLGIVAGWVAVSRIVLIEVLTINRWKAEGRSPKICFIVLSLLRSWIFRRIERFRNSRVRRAGSVSLPLSTQQKERNHPRRVSSAPEKERASQARQGMGLPPYPDLRCRQIKVGQTKSRVRVWSGQGRGQGKGEGRGRRRVHGRMNRNKVSQIRSCGLGTGRGRGEGRGRGVIGMLDIGGDGYSGLSVGIALKGRACATRSGTVTVSLWLSLLRVLYPGKGHVLPTRCALDRNERISAGNSLC